MSLNKTRDVSYMRMILEIKKNDNIVLFNNPNFNEELEQISDDDDEQELSNEVMEFD